MHVVAARHERDKPGHLAARDVAAETFAQSCQPGGIEARRGGHHRSRTERVATDGDASGRVPAWFLSTTRRP